MVLLPYVAKGATPYKETTTLHKETTMNKLKQLIPSVLRAFGAVCLSGILAAGNVAFADSHDYKFDWRDSYIGERKEELDKKRGKDGWTYLHEEVARDRTLQMRQIIRGGADLDITTETRGWTALHLAAKQDHTRNMRILIIRRASINVRDKEGKTPLHIAAEHGNLKAVVMLLHERADYSARDDMGRTPFHLAAMVPPGKKSENKIRSDILDRLHIRGADPNSQDIDGKTALHFAAEKDNDALVTHLIAVRSVDKNLQDDNGYDALVHAAIAGKENTANLLIQRFGMNKAILSKNGGLDGTGPLHRAAEYNNRRAVELLIKLGVDVKVKDQSGRTALHWAAEHDSPKAARGLLDKGADLHAKANWHYDGFTPLHVAAYRNSRNAAAVFLDYGVSKWEADKLGKPAYEYARHYHGEWSEIACMTWPHEADENCSERHD